MPATDSATLGHGRMRAFVVACVGLATAVLVAACGGRSGLIPAANANTLIADLHNVAAAVFKQDCTATSTGIQQAEVDFNNLPPSVDAALVTQLQDGLITLAADAAKQCQGSTSNTGATGSTNHTGSTGATTTSSSTASSAATTTSSTTSSAATTTSNGGTSSAATTTSTNASSSAATTTGNGDNNGHSDASHHRHQS